MVAIERADSTMDVSRPRDGQPSDLEPIVRDSIRALKAVDFELACLALLTHQGLKPISRWPEPLERHALQALERLDLQVRRVRRTVRAGRPFDETIFGRSMGYLDVYAAHFADRPVDQSAETLRIEGFLFGYPPCCVAQYIKHHYAPDEFPTEEHETLFHRSCKGCQITPLLLPAYEHVRRLVDRC